MLQRATVLEAMNGWLVRGPRRAFMSAITTVQSAINIQRVWRGTMARVVYIELKKHRMNQLAAIIRIQAYFRRWRLRRAILLEAQKFKEAKNHKS